MKEKLWPHIKNGAINLISIKFNVKPTKWIVKYGVYTTNLNA